MGLITKETDCAMRALIYLHRRSGEKCSTRELSAGLALSRPFLRKVLQRLSGAGMVESERGREGGFTLRAMGEIIYLKNLVSLFQGEIDFARCEVKSGLCPNVTTCRLHRKLKSLESFFLREIGNLDIATLSANSHKKKTAPRAGTRSRPPSRR